MQRRSKVILFVALLLVTLGGISLVSLERITRVELDRLTLPPCTLYYDCHDRLMRFVPDKDGRRHLWIDGSEIPEKLKNAFIAAEDQRFHDHLGIDPVAILRAVRDNILQGRIVSGASTITQQLIRLSYPRQRSFYDKLIEAVRAIRLERSLSKDEILTLYLNRVPLGNNLLGIRAASAVYFGKECEDLTIAEAAVLAALPKAPSSLNPYGRHREQLLVRRNRVLKRMRKLSPLPHNEWQAEIERPITFLAKHFPMAAPHFVDHLILNGNSNEPEAGRNIEVRTTVDNEVQRRVQWVLDSHRARLHALGASQAAVVILDNRDVSVLAMAGSVSYQAQYGGFNNGAMALRSPGSALKPFLYAQALDSGYTAATILEDIPRRYAFAGGTYDPVNFDRESYGPVTFREALANSLNLSAVHLLNRIGYSRFYELLKQLELINFPQYGPDHYGLGMVVGNPEVTLLQLTTAYATLANGGLFRPARLLRTAPAERPRRIFSAQAAFVITSILADTASRTITFSPVQTLGFTYPVAVKTGTSTHYRDGWIVGYTAEHTVGVWVGNFDGHPTAGLSGSTGAAPILADLLQNLYHFGLPSTFERPSGVDRVKVCSFSGMKPGPHCPQTRWEWFLAGHHPQQICSFHHRDGLHHELPAPFTMWVYDRYRMGREGRYRIAELDQDLARTFGPSARGNDQSGKRELLTAPITIGNRQRAGLGPEQYRTIQNHPAGPAITITNPLNGTHFLRPAGQDCQRLTFRATVERPVESVTWFVDGIEAAEAGPPYALEWNLEPGTHTLLGETPDHLSDMIMVRVD